MQLWILLLIVMGLWTIYWLFARPAFLVASRMELFRIRHKMRMLSQEECPAGDQAKARGVLQWCLALALRRSISLTLIVTGRKGDEVQAQRDIEDILSSTAESKDVFERMIQTVLATTVASSALLLIPCLSRHGALPCGFRFFVP